MSRINTLHGLIIFTALSTVSTAALAQAAQGNQVYDYNIENRTDSDNDSSKNFFYTDLVRGEAGNNTLFANVTTGVGNKGRVFSKTSFSTLTNVQQNGSNNGLLVDNSGANYSSNMVYQGNSLEQSRINGAAVNVANHNDAVSKMTGVNQNVTIVQKGNENVSSSDVSGSASDVSVIQEMRDIALADIVDSQGNHYRGGNDSTVRSSGDKNKISLIQYNGNVSKINTQGNNNKVSAVQVNTLFTPDRKYNNVNVTTQTGNNHSTTVKQTGAGEQAYVTQNGSDNKVDITQNLGGGVVQLTQNGTNGNAKITQTASNIVQHTVSGNNSNNNSIEVTQTGGGTGTENKLNAPQSGNNNKLTVTQTGDANSISGVIPATTATGQAGDANTYTATQTGVGSTALYLQAGNTNVVSLTQTGDRHNASTLQQGNNNNALIAQANENDDKATVAQNGNNNRVGIWQGNGVLPGGHDFPVANVGGNIANITQTGDQNGVFQIQKGANNSFTATQTGNSNYISGGGNLNEAQASIWTGSTPWALRNDAGPAPQVGTGHESVMVQTGNNNTMIIDPFGNRNIQHFTQKGNNNFIYGTGYGDDHKITITQTGGGNVAFGSTTGEMTAHLTGVGNTLTYSQTSPDNTPIGQGNWIGSNTGPSFYGAQTAGNYNTVDITQKGASSIIYLVNGNNNRMLLSQDNAGPDGSVISGYRNTLTANQNGNGNVLQASQIGRNNQFTVTQNGGSFLSYTQQGNGLTATINQPVGASATIVQTHN